MSNFLQKLVIKHALQKPAPNWISSSDGKLDCKAVLISFSRKWAPEYRIVGIEEKYFSAVYVSDDDGRYDCCISFSASFGLNLRIRHWYRSVETTYFGTMDYIWGAVTLTPWREEWRQKLRQRSYNLSLKIRDDSTEILQLVVEEHLRRKSREGTPLIGNIRISRFEIPGLIYGPNIWGHPRHQEILARLDLIIDSLVFSNDLLEDNNYISVNGKAISSISSNVSDDRKHRDQMSYNRRIVWLTVALVLVGLPQFFDGASKLFDSLCQAEFLSYCPSDLPKQN